MQLNTHGRLGLTELSETDTLIQLNLELHTNNLLHSSNIALDVARPIVRNQIRQDLY